jgi:DNA sulfur modification protein DndB
MLPINQDNVNTIPAETQAKFSSFIEPFFSEHHRSRCYIGLIFNQGKRKMLQINVPASDFSGLLQAKPSTDNDPDSGKNRPEVKGHTEEIKKYIVDHAEKEKSWILGTLTANVNPKDIKILEFGRGVCLVVIPRGVKLDITDGQHRKRAIHELIESNNSHLISDDDFPITLVLEGDLHQCQTDFRDMAQTRQLDKSLLLSFGEFSGQVGITKELIKSVSMFRDKTEKIKSTPSSKNKLIYTTNFIARFVSCVFTNDATDQLRDYDVSRRSSALINCLNRFFSESSYTQHIAGNKAQDLTVQEVEAFKDNCLLGVSVGLEILGRLLHSSYFQEHNYFDEAKVSQLAQFNWSRENQIWVGCVIRLESNPRNSQKPYKINNTANSVIEAVRRVQLELAWL